MYAHTRTREFLAQKNVIKSSKEGNIYENNTCVKNNDYLCVAL